MPEITKTDAASPPFAVPSWACITFGVLVLLVYFSGLNVPLMGPDEPRYAEVAREMWQSGDWLTPTLGGHPWFEKPPLLYWFEIAAFSIFGVSEFAARLGPVLCGLGTVAAIWLIGKTEERSSRADLARHLALIAASTLGIIVFSHAAGFDIVLTFTLTAALTAFYVFDRRGDTDSAKAGVRPLIFFYLFVGLAILAKGLIGLIFPFAIIGLYCLLSRRWPVRTFLISLIWGLPLVFLIAAPWHVAMYRRYGSEFIDVYFLQNHFQRFTTNKYLHPQPFYFFFWVLPMMTLPWMPFFLAAMWRAGRNVLDRVVSPISLFAISWLAVPLVFFTFSGSKLPGYVLPAVPAAIVVTGFLLFELVHKSRKWRMILLAIAATTLVISGVGLIFFLPGFAEHDSVKTFIQAADEKGYASSRVLTLHVNTQSVEYYAAGRLLRDDKGVQQTLDGARLVLDEINKDGGKPVLVLVPLKYMSQLTEYDKVKTELIEDNGEIAIVVVNAK